MDNTSRIEISVRSLGTDHNILQGTTDTSAGSYLKGGSKNKRENVKDRSAVMNVV